MKKSLILIIIFCLLIGCSSDTDSASVSITAVGLSDDKLAIFNTATFEAELSNYDGEISELTYQWTLSTENAELSDGVNALPNGIIVGSSINCVGKTEGDEQITVEVIDASNNIVARASYDFIVIPSDDNAPIDRGCFDQPKIVYLQGASLYVCNYDGTDPEFTGVSGAFEASISPNGQLISYTDYFYTSPLLNGYVVKLANCDGTEAIEIPEGYEEGFTSGDGESEFSPDSQTLYLERPNLESVPAVPNGGRPLELVAYEIETGEVRYLTSLYQQNETVRTFTVSPTTGEIAFIRATYDSTTPEQILTLGIMQPTTGFVQDLAVLPQAQFFGMDWSKDGQDIIYSASTSQESGIFRINTTSGSQPLLVFADPSTESQPPFFPHYYANDDRIIWAGQENGDPNTRLWSVDANGNDMQRFIDANAISTGVLY